MEVEATSTSVQIKQVGLAARLQSDERLAREVEAGRDSAFTVLFNRHHQALYRYCRSLVGNDQDAQDALQSALTKALMALRAGRRNAPLRPWLFRIAHNESITQLRSRQVTVELPTQLESPRGLSDVIEENERFATLLRDLHELSEKQRAALVLRELSGLSHEEIADVLKISVGAAKQTILEARRSLREFAEGRTSDCSQIEQLLSSDDRRSLRSRRVRAHLRACPACAAFAEAIPQRRAEMLALWPALPAAGAAGLLAKLTGASSTHAGGGAASLTAGAAAKGLGAAVSLKAAALGTVAVVAVAAAGALTILHDPQVRAAGTAGQAVSPGHPGQPRPPQPARHPVPVEAGGQVRSKPARHASHQTGGIRTVTGAHHGKAPPASRAGSGNAGAIAPSDSTSTGRATPPASHTTPASSSARTLKQNAAARPRPVAKSKRLTHHRRQPVQRVRRRHAFKQPPGTTRPHRHGTAGGALSSGQSGTQTAGPGHGSAGASGNGQKSEHILSGSARTADTATTS